MTETLELTKKEIQQKRKLHDLFTSLINFLLFLLLFLVPLVYYRMQIKMFSYPKWLLIRCGVVLAFSLMVIKKLLLGELNFRKNFLLPTLLLFNLIAFLSIFKAQSVYLALWDYTNIFFYSLGFFLLVNHLKSLRQLYNFQTLIIITGTIAATYGVIQFMGWDPFFPDIPISGSRMRIFSFFGNPNFFAGFLLIIIPLIFYRIFTQALEWKIFYLIVLLPYGVSLLATRTRSSWISVVVSLGFIFTVLLIEFFLKRKELSEDKKEKFRRYFKNILYLLLVFLFLLLIVIPGISKIYLQAKTGKSVPLYKIYEPYFERFYTIFNLQHVHTRQRLLLWQVTLMMARGNPILGVGIGNFKQRYFEYQRKFFQKQGTKKYYDVAASPLRAHNEYIQMLGEMGILGLSAFLLFIITIFYYHLKIYFATEDEDRKFFILFTLSSLVAVLTHSLVSFPFHRPAVSFYFFIYCGILSVEDILYKKEKEKKKVIYFPWSRVGAIEIGSALVIFILALLISYQAYKIFEANRLLKMGMIISQQNVLNPQVEKFYKKSLSLDPNYGETHFRLAQYYQMQADYYQMPQLKRQLVGTKFKTEEEWKQFIISRYHDALKEFEISLETVDSRFTYFYMGLLWEKLSELEGKPEYLFKGYKLYKYITEVMPNYTKAQYNFGVLCYKIIEKLGDKLSKEEKERYLEEAKRAWEYAITYVNVLEKKVKESPEYIRAFYNLAIYNFNHQNYGVARKYLKKVLELQPQNKDADKYLKILERNEKMYLEKAREMLAKNNGKLAREYLKLVLKLNPLNQEARELISKIK